MHELSPVTENMKIYPNKKKEIEKRKEEKGIEEDNTRKGKKTQILQYFKGKTKE